MSNKSYSQLKKKYLKSNKNKNILSQNSREKNNLLLLNKNKSSLSPEKNITNT